jgi:hypothetical protein
MVKYDNATKASSRGWAWNRICEEIRGSFNRKRARIYVLIGETNAELETAERKGFSRHNVIGVDLEKEHVQRWRAAGGLAIQAPLEAVITFSKVYPQGIIADFCNGVTVENVHTVMCALFHCVAPGCVIANLLRGRDKIKTFSLPYFQINPQEFKRRSRVLWEEIFANIIYHNYGVDLYNDERAYSRNSEWAAICQNAYDEMVERFQPNFSSYRSEDSGQWFDTLALKATLSPEDILPLRQETVDRLSQKYDVALVKRRLAALEAVRTKKLQQLPRHKRAKYA